MRQMLYQAADGRGRDLRPDCAAEKEAVDRSVDWCDEVGIGYVCTRAKGHLPPHITGFPHRGGDGPARLKPSIVQVWIDC